VPSELLSHEDQYRECLRKGQVFIKKLKKWEENDEDKSYRWGIKMKTLIEIKI
jgi:hypothetical protein